MRLVHAAGALVAVLVLAFASGCGGGGDSTTGGGSTGGGDESGALSFDGSAYPGNDLANTRMAKSEIESGNVSSLKQAWKVPLTAESSFGSYAATPVIADGVVYSQDLESNVQAIDLASGEVLWTKSYEEPDQGPNGVTVGGGMVYGGTPTSAFALDAETGEEEWSVRLADGEGEALDMSPGVHGGLVFVSTVPTNLRAEYPAGGVGTVWAFDAKTGKKEWHFDTVPKSLWGDKSLNAGGGFWYSPSFDGKGAMYIGVGNPVPFPGAEGKPFGASRPGPNLYSNSIVKLDEKTGKVLWHYQATPHDLYDWDFQDPPILASAGGRELAIGAGKSGIVAAVDAKTGKEVWRTPVGTHNGHDDDGLLAMRGESSKIKLGTVYPGLLGGVIAPMATDGKTLYVPIVNHPLELVSGTEVTEGGGESTGEVAALDLATGKLKWKAKFPTPVYGAPTVSNDVVFVSGFEGVVRALDAKSGGEIWQGSLPAGSNTGLAVSGDTLVVPAGLPVAEGQTPALVAYRLGGE